MKGTGSTTRESTNRTLIEKTLHRLNVARLGYVLSQDTIKIVAIAIICAK